MNEVGAAGFGCFFGKTTLLCSMLKIWTNVVRSLNIAFAVSASFVIGDHLGFTAGQAPR